MADVLSKGKPCENRLNHPVSDSSRNLPLAEWKNGWLQRCLAGLRILAGTASGVAGCWYYGGRHPASSEMETPIQNYSAQSAFNPFMPHPGSDGVLEESFGNHRLHHDNNDATDSATQKTAAETTRSGIPLYKASDGRRKREPASSKSIEICQKESILKRCQ